jgi:hypothetical protein
MAQSHSSLSDVSSVSNANLLGPYHCQALSWFCVGPLPKSQLRGCCSCAHRRGAAARGGGLTAGVAVFAVLGEDEASFGGVSDGCGLVATEAVTLAPQKLLPGERHTHLLGAEPPAYPARALQDEINCHAPLFIFGLVTLAAGDVLIDQGRQVGCARTDLRRWWTAERMMGHLPAACVE